MYEPGENTVAETAYLCASRYAVAYVVTAAVDRVKFESPVRVEEKVVLEAAVRRRRRRRRVRRSRPTGGAS